MVHQYKLNGYNIVLDTCSGAVHVVDEVAYDMIALFKEKSKEEILSEMLEKYGNSICKYNKNIKIYANGIQMYPCGMKKIMNRINALAYDHKCKKVLCDKRLLSYVLKLAVEEYKGLSIEEIEPLIESGVVMEEEAHILFPRVNENVDENGKKTIFDILLTSKYPNSDNSIDTIINLEMQNDALPKSKDHKSYSLIKRGIFYVGKMIVNQKGVTFTSNNYQNLKKVNSIWICSRPKKDKENSVQRYKIHEEHVLGKMIEELQDNYDMINVCMINLGKDGIKVYD